MASFKTSGIKAVTDLNKKATSKIKSATNFEQAAQDFIDLFYEQYEDHLALARVFLTIPFAELPDFNRQFVENLAQQNSVSDQLKDHTPVLSLMATRGRQPQWNDRRQSQGHVGIPLISKQFIEAIPMVSRLLKDFGMGLDWVDKVSSGLHVQTFGKSAGTFHVPDAKRSVDEQNRKIIPMQDFVEEQDVRTVFGIGGGYKTSFMVAIFFTKEEIDKLTVRRYESLVFGFTRKTLLLVQQKRFFGKRA